MKNLITNSCSRERRQPQAGAADLEESGMERDGANGKRLAPINYRQLTQSRSIRPKGVEHEDQ